MRLLDGFRFLGLSLLGLASFTLAPSVAGESPKGPAKTPNRVVIKSGTTGSPERPRPIEPACFDVAISSLAAKEQIAFELPINNTSSAPIKILGGNSGCSEQGCIRPLGKYPRWVPAGEAGKVEFLYTAPKLAAATTPQHVVLDVECYVGAATTFAVPFHISAEIVPAKVEKSPQTR